MDYQSSTSHLFGKLIEFNKRFKIVTIIIAPVC